MSNKQKTEKNYTINDIVTRLDVIIRFLIDSKPDDEKFNKTNIIPILNKLGLDPSAIASIFGNNKASDVSPYLYKKKKEKGSKL
jgi:hypothetical protein